MWVVVVVCLLRCWLLLCFEVVQGLIVLGVGHCRDVSIFLVCAFRFSFGVGGFGMGWVLCLGYRCWVAFRLGCYGFMNIVLCLGLGMFRCGLWNVGCLLIEFCL